jgi:hypothetical protein
MATVSMSVTTLAAYTAANARSLSSLSNLRPREPGSTRTSFISADLLEAATDLVKNGVQVGDGLAGGTVYVHVRPRGFGGVLSVRYRR